MAFGNPHLSSESWLFKKTAASVRRDITSLFNSLRQFSSVSSRSNTLDGHMRSVPHYQHSTINITIFRNARLMMTAVHPSQLLPPRRNNGDPQDLPRHLLPPHRRITLAKGNSLPHRQRRHHLWLLLLLRRPLLLRHAVRLPRQRPPTEMLGNPRRPLRNKPRSRPHQRPLRLHPRHLAHHPNPQSLHALPSKDQCLPDPTPRLRRQRCERCSLGLYQRHDV